MREGFFFMIQQIVKRDGRMAPFEIDKITNAIFGAAQASGGQDHDMAQELAEQVEKTLEETAGTETPTVEQVQDTVEKVLIESGHARTAKEYILYRDERTRVREMNTRLMKIVRGSDLQVRRSRHDIKRENANIDGDTAMGTMLKYGSEGAKQFYEMFILDPEHAKAHREGDIHIHDLDFLTLTTTCCQIDLHEAVPRRLFHRSRLPARAERHPFSYSRAGLHRHPVQPERPARRSEHAELRLRAWPRACARPSASVYRDNLAKALEVFGEDDNDEVEARALTEHVEQQTGKLPLVWQAATAMMTPMAKSALREALDEETLPSA